MMKKLLGLTLMLLAVGAWVLDVHSLWILYHSLSTVEGTVFIPVVTLIAFVPFFFGMRLVGLG